jgi:hypothetical protein
MARSLAAIGAGLLAGLLIGVFGVFAMVAAWIGDDHRRAYDRTALLPYWTTVWVALTDPASLPYLAGFATAAAANGAIGGWAGRRGSRQVLPVAWIPLGVLVFAAVLIAWEFDAKGWVAVLLPFVFIGVFVWVAGRVGQEVGARLRPTEPAAASGRPAPRGQ